MVLDHLVIQSMDSKGKIEEGKEGQEERLVSNPDSLSKEELDIILRFNAVDIFNQDNANTKEMDIDEILARAEVSDRTSFQYAFYSISSEPEVTPAEELLNTFKVTSIASQGDDFWSKLISPEMQEEMVTSQYIF